MFARKQRASLLSIVAAIAIAALLAACGGDDDSSGDGGGGGAATDPPATDVVAMPPEGELIRPGVLSICTETGTPPAAFYDEQNEIAGYLPDLGRMIAERMGLEANFVDSVFDTIIVAANTGKCELIVADQFITPEREEQINMIPYAQIGQLLMTTADKASEFGNPAEDPSGLCGSKVGVLSGAAQVDTLDEWSAECESGGKPAIDTSIFSNTPAGLQALQGGQADLFFTDSPVASYYGTEQSEDFATVGDPVKSVKAGISVPMEKTGVEQALRDVLESMNQDGSYEALFTDAGQEALIIPNPGQN